MSKLDDVRADHAVRALSLVLRAANVDKLAPEGQGVIECPACKGKLHYSFVRTKPSRRRQSLTYVAQCETAACVTFRGH